MSEPLPPHALITTGATASFRPLLLESLSPPFLTTLLTLGFRSLTLQCGPDHAFVASLLSTLPCPSDLTITSFALTPSLHSEMLRCRGHRGVQRPGVVISHGGTGTIGEAVRVGVPLVVVANSGLMDDHQREVVGEVEGGGWGVVGELGHLHEAVRRAMEMAEERGLGELGPYVPPPFPVPEEERVTVFDWVMLGCWPEERRRQEREGEVWCEREGGQKV
ncbi:hypothetical protein QBC39DRAFT_385256 [Podospora conica]|nr:hypothetical protein QBC39DRAFT_385256 [Schizothecium conicum]